MRIFIWNSQEALLPGMDFPSMEEWFMAIPLHFGFPAGGGSCLCPGLDGGRQASDDCRAILHWQASMSFKACGGICIRAVERSISRGDGASAGNESLLLLLELLRHGGCHGGWSWMLGRGRSHEQAPGLE